MNDERRFLYRLLGSEFGPFSREEMQSLIESEMLPADAEIRDLHARNSPYDEWRAVSELSRDQSGSQQRVPSAIPASPPGRIAPVAPTRPTRADLEDWFSRTMSEDQLVQSQAEDHWSGPHLPPRDTGRSSRGPLVSLIFDPWLWGAVALLAIGNGLWFWMQPQPNLVDNQRYHEVEQFLADVRQKRHAKVSSEEWDRFAAALTEKAENLLLELDSEQEAPARQCLQWALQYRLPKILKYGRYRSTYQEVAYEHLLQEAQRQLHRDRQRTVRRGGS